MPQLSLHSPVGDLTLSSEDDAIVSLDWGWGRDQKPTRLLAQASAQLQAYFDGDLTEFELQLAPAGTTYRQRVWAALRDIPFGAILTYARLASIAGRSARSVGQAVGANPIPILIPCHRVVAGGGLGGFSGGEGVITKQHLLALERLSGREREGDSSTARQMPGAACGSPARRIFGGRPEPRLTQPRRCGTVLPSGEQS